MPLYARKGVVLAKAEGTQGTDSVPTGAANSIEVSDLVIRPVVARTAERKLLRPFFGAADKLIVGEYAEVEFTVSAAGAGTSAITPPKFGPLLVGCGCAQTIGASDVSFLPVSGGFGALSIYAYLGDAVLHKIIGSMGTVDVEVGAEQVPSMRFRFIGMYAAPTDAASSGVVYTGWQQPVGVRDSSIPVFSLHGVTKANVPYRSLRISLGNELNYRNLIGSRGAQIADRAVTGSVQLEASTVATKDWSSSVVNAAAAALQVQVGTAAFNIFQIDAPKVRLFEPTLSEEDGISMLNLSLEFMPNAGNDEVKFSTK